MTSLRIAPLFEMPSAEREPWLDEVFVRHTIFEKLLTSESIIVHGAPGIGKTALRVMLQKLAPSDKLVIPWLLEPVSNSEASTTLAETSIRQAIKALLENIVPNPEIAVRLRQAPPFVGNAIHWFLQEYLPYDLEFYIEMQSAALQNESLTWYRRLLNQPTAKILRDHATQNDHLRILTNVFQKMGFSQIWWLVDGLEKWTIYSGNNVLAIMESVLSKLSLFDKQEIAFKFFIPESFKDEINKTNAVLRERLLPDEFIWNTEELVTLLEKRLSVGLNQPGYRLTQLCHDDDFLRWMEKYAGSNPRAWISRLRPFAEYFENTGKPLEEQDWQTVAHVSPPPLHVYSERREVRIGEFSIAIESQDSLKILLYLQQRTGQICSLEEVYFCGIKGLPKPPGVRDEGWEHKDIWRPALDTTLYRLRKKLEWDPSRPVYLVTHPRRGLELLHSRV